ANTLIATSTQGKGPSANDVVTHLRSIAALSATNANTSLVTGSVTVTGSAPYYTITYGATLGARPLGAAGLLTGATAGTGAMETLITAGKSPTEAELEANLRSIPLLSGNEVQYLTLVQNGNIRLKFAAATETQDLAVVLGPDGTTAAAVQTHLETIPAFNPAGGAKISVTGPNGGPFTITFTGGSFALTNVASAPGFSTPIIIDAAVSQANRAAVSAGIDGNAAISVDVTGDPNVAPLSSPNPNYTITFKGAL